MKRRRAGSKTPILEWNEIVENTVPPFPVWYSAFLVTILLGRLGFRSVLSHTLSKGLFRRAMTRRSDERIP